MQSFLTVVTPAANQDLTDLATVKAALGITDTSEDANLSKYITQASGDIRAYCNRIFLKQTYKETFRVLFVRGLQREHLDQVCLSVSPLATIDSLTLDSATLTENTDFERDGEGNLYRLDAYGNGVRWYFGRLVVQYDAGWEYTSLPSPIGHACIDLVKLARSASTRDPLVKAESIPGVGDVQYWIGDVPGTVGNLPPNIQAELDPFRRITV